MQIVVSVSYPFHVWLTNINNFIFIITIITY